MKKQKLFKIIILAVLCLFAFGIPSLAALKETIEPRWSYITSTGYLFTKDQELTNYDIFGVGGNTTVPSSRYAYVKVELQYLNNSGSWVNFGTWEDEGRAGAAVEEYIQVTPGYTYRLKTTHKAMDANGNVLETFYDEPDYYIASFSRD